MAIKKHKKHKELKSIVVHDLNDSVFNITGSQRYWFYSRFCCSMKWTCTFLLFSWQFLVLQSFHTCTEPLVDRLSTQKHISLANCIAVGMQKARTQVWNTILKLKENGGQMHKDERVRGRTGRAQSGKTVAGKKRKIFILFFTFL